VRKLIVISVMLFLLLGVSTADSYFYTEKKGCGFVFGANVMEVDSYFFTIADMIPPSIIIISPAEGAIDQAHDVSLVVEVRDLQAGIDINNATLTVMGQVYPFTYEPIDDGYRITISDVNWGWGKRIDYNVKAQDLAN